MKRFTIKETAPCVQVWTYEVEAETEEDISGMSIDELEELAKQMGDYDSAVIALQDERGLSRDQAEAIASQVFPEDEGEIEDMIARAEEEESGKYTTGGEQFQIRENKSKWENTSGKSMYVQFKEIDNLNGQEVLIGIDFEIEKNPELSKIEAIKLVLKNLKKNPVYYTATLMAGKEMTEIPTIGKLKPGSDKMRELKGEDSMTDKDNGMKPVKDIEKVKASANKAKKETNKAAGTISLMSLVAKASRGVQKMNATGEKMKVVKEGLDEVTIKRGPADTKSQLVDTVKAFVESNPTLKMYQNDISLVDQGSEEEVIFQLNGEAIPDGVKIALEKQYNVKEEEIPVGETTVKIHYVLTPKFKKSTQSPIAQALTKEDLMEMIREELSEMLSNQQETDNIALDIDETFDGRDNLTKIDNDE